MKPEYYITDGTKFVKQNINGQYKTVSGMNLADVWDNAKVAKSVLSNSVPKVWRKTFYVAKYENGDLIKWSLSEDEKEERRDELTSANKEKREYKLGLYSFKEDKGIQDIIKGFEAVNTVLKDTENLHFELKKELTTLDLMLEDLKHYRLKKKLGTVDSYKFKKLGDEIVLKRVSIKNQLDILYKINQHRSAIQNQIKDICNTIDAVRNKTYTPRILLDLFENDNLDIKVV